MDTNGLLRECSEFFHLVMAEFRFLLEDGGFYIVKRDVAHQGERCLVILASADYQLKLMFDRGALESYIGPVEATRRWENVVDGSVEWYGLHNFIEVALDTRRSTPEEWRILGQKLLNMPLDSKIQEVAKLLTPVCQELAAFFREGRLAEIKHELE